MPIPIKTLHQVLIALVAGVDRIFDMGRTTVNITGDAACAVCVNAMDLRREAKLKAKERERKRKALEDAARQAEKDAQTLEKYRKKFEEQKANEAAKAASSKSAKK